MVTFTSQQLDLWIAAFIWPFVRILALMSVAPVFGHLSIPARVKVGLAFLMALIVAPTLDIPAPVALDSAQGIALLLQQILTGLAIGFSITLVFAAIQLGGDLIGLQMGLSFASFVDPQSSTQTPLVGSLFTVLATLVLLAMDGHLIMLGAIVKSFAVVPMSADFQNTLHWHALLGWGTEIFSIGLHLALPALAAIFLSNVALGVLTRSAPQLNLFAVGFPVTLLLGILILWLSLPHFGRFFEQALQRGFGILF